MPYTETGLELLGFLKNIESKEISAKFQSISIYEAKNIEIDFINFEIIKHIEENFSVDFFISQDIKNGWHELTGLPFDENNIYLRKFKGPFIYIKIENDFYETRIPDRIRLIDNSINTRNVFQNSLSLLKKHKENFEKRFLAFFLTDNEDAKFDIEAVHIDTTIFGYTKNKEIVIDENLEPLFSSISVRKFTASDLRNRILKSIRNSSFIENRPAQLIYSGLRERDPMKKFIFLFQVIEKIINPLYKKHYPNTITNKEIPNLRQKFNFCAQDLLHGITLEDTESFKNLVKIRNELSHGSEVVITWKNVEATKELAKKILISSMNFSVKGQVLKE